MFRFRRRQTKRLLSELAVEKTTTKKRKEKKKTIFTATDSKEVGSVVD